MNPGREPSRTSMARFAAALVLAAATPATAPAGAAQGQWIEAGAGCSAWYDSNLLQYSDSQRSRFDSGVTPERFSIHSVDDLVGRSYVTLAWRSRGEGDRGRTVRLRGSGAFHSENATADFRSVSAVWRESFSRGSQLSLYGYYLPRYYLRQLLDEDVAPGVYRRAEFSLGIGSIAWRQRLARRARAEVRYQFERRAYNREFQERTSNTHQGDATLEWHRLPRRGRLELSAGYRTSDARAEDGDDAALAVPDDADVSYHGVVGAIGARADLARMGDSRLAGDAAVELETRDYTSDRPGDTSHFGRNDTGFALEGGLRWIGPEGWSLRGFYRFERNDADLATLSSTTDLGSYTQHRLGVSLDWSRTIWRRSADVEPEDEEETD